MSLVPLMCCVCFFFFLLQQKPGEKPVPGKTLIFSQDLKNRLYIAVSSSCHISFLLLLLRWLGILALPNCAKN